MTVEEMLLAIHKHEPILNCSKYNDPLQNKLIYCWYLQFKINKTDKFIWEVDLHKLLERALKMINKEGK